MTPLELVHRYMEIFYSGEKLDRLEPLMHDDFKFRGPFFKFNSSRDYIESLRAEPPLNCSYKIIEEFENNNTVNLIYTFAKPGITTIMSQLFRIRSNRIEEIHLIFDSAAFLGDL